MVSQHETRQRRWSSIFQEQGTVCEGQRVKTELEIITKVIWISWIVGREEIVLTSEA